MKETFTPGTTFAGYRLEALVGRGGMGVVYRATDLSLERPVALKLVAPELAEDERFRARFLREPRLAASLDHPNVIPIYEAGEHDGQLYLAMRFVEGSDLKSVLEREGRLRPERALDVLAQVAGALDAAHRRALVHRDVKPANVLMGEEGHVYLTDFGITKQLGGESTDTGRVVGTLDYLAPEQIRGDPVDGRTDVYALGCLLYECLSGAPPFRRATEAETMWAHMQEQPPPLKGHAALEPGAAKGARQGPRGPLQDLRRADRRRRAGARTTGTPAPARTSQHCGAEAGACWPPACSCWRRSSRSRSSPSRAATTSMPSRSGTELPRSTPRTVTSLPSPSRERRRATSRWARARSGSLNNEERTVSRIDPETKEVSETFDTPGVPSELAAGEGALWIGNAGGGDFSQRHGQRVPARSRVGPGHANGAAPRRRGRVSGGGRAPDCRGRRCGLGGQPRRERVPHRSRERTTRRHDRGPIRRVDDRRRPGGSLVPRASRTIRWRSDGSTRARTV